MEPIGNCRSKGGTARWSITFFLYLLSIEFHHGSVLGGATGEQAVVGPSSSGSHDGNRTGTHQGAHRRLSRRTHSHGHRGGHHNRTPNDHTTNKGAASNDGNRGTPGSPHVNDGAPVPLNIARGIAGRRGPGDRGPVLSPRTRLRLLRASRHLSTLLRHLRTNRALDTRRRS